MKEIKIPNECPIKEVCHNLGNPQGLIDQGQEAVDVFTGGMVYTIHCNNGGMVDCRKQNPDTCQGTEGKLDEFFKVIWPDLNLED